MTQSNVSGWLWDMQKQNSENVQVLAVSYETKPEVNFGSPISPLLEIRKQVMIDATAGHRVHITKRLAKTNTGTELHVMCDYKVGNTYRHPKPDTI